MSRLDGIPQNVEVGFEEIYPLAVDFGPVSFTGIDTLQSVEVEFVDLFTQVDIAGAALQGGPAISGYLAEVIIVGAALIPGRSYRLRTTGTYGPNKVLTLDTTIWCRT